MAAYTITIAQQKGGSGKTTVAANLAVYLLSQGHTVAVLDTDPQGSLGRWFMTRNDATEGQPGMEFSTASAWGVGYEAGKLRKSATFVIIDTPPKADGDLRPALREADLVVVPVAASQLDLWATEAVLELVDRTRKPALTVLNRARAHTRLGAEVTRQMRELQAPVAEAVLGNRVVFAEALGEGFGVTEWERSGAAAKEIAALGDEICKILGC
ncbi:ParA family partition ATPase [Tropicimonas sp. IMCC34043]|uniref:ParA family partition ATPase n=1 Tax=Tropicimonas sp. IMCC34043 TaxID=2248760 RepID=UPI000E289492|nr:ParA family partition ATPase [Tropicimonas sp. IMCC34043]